MTRLYNDPTDFADEMTAGFVAANRRYVRAVPGGVIRSSVTEQGGVAVVIGGGSGHYPAFAGLVGQGLAHGAAMGNLFASPSAQQVHSVAAAAEHGGGVLLSYGNYAGDVLNFDAAQRRLRAEGIETETVAVTDDVSSAPLAEKHMRRGVAGDLTVFTAAAAASESGLPLAEVARVARLANERTRSFGVAFTGCTLPGAEAPLFTVPEGRMAVGMGIHGEPGIAEADIPTADELAELLVSRLLEELPDGVTDAAGQRVVPILNGLGSVKYEELFVVYGRIAALLEAAGIEIVDPQVGEFCTSFDMAGTSLTLYWLDDELERFWGMPINTPAYRRGSAAAVEQLGEGIGGEGTGAAGAGAEGMRAAGAGAAGAGSLIPGASDESRAAAVTVVAALNALTATVERHADELGRIDAVAGDGDHGIGMLRGARAASKAATAALAGDAGAGSVLALAADAWSDRAGGTSGALWGAALAALGRTIGDDSAPDAATVAAGLTAGRDAIVDYGKAQVGDKTMIDAIVPFVEALTSAVRGGADLPTAWAAAAEVATTAAASTADLLPRLGRARPHAEKSLGTPDAGAHSFALIAQSVSVVLSTAGAPAAPAAPAAPDAAAE